MNKDWFMDYAEHAVRVINIETRWLELRGWITKNGRHILIGEDGGGSSGSGAGRKAAKKVDKAGESGIIEEKTGETAGTDVHKVGKINRDIYRCVTEDIVTDEVIITDERIKHIKDHHPNDFELYCEYMKEIVESPEYIIEANKPKSALILKSFENNSVPFKTVLRLVTSTDNPKFKNSIITFMKIDDSEWDRLIRNKKVLYKSE